MGGGISHLHDDQLQLPVYHNDQDDFFIIHQNSECETSFRSVSSVQSCLSLVDLEDDVTEMSQIYKFSVKKSLSPYKDGYQRESTLRIGQYSTIYKGYRKKDQKEVAIKEINLSKISSKQEKEVILEELSLLCSVSHSSILGVKSVYECATPLEEKLFVVSDLINGGEFVNTMIQNGSYREDDLSYYMNQFINGIAYLHSNEIIHNNLIPENLVLCSHPSSASSSSLSTISACSTCYFSFSAKKKIN
jgi:serine/threonine protein kinase